MPKDLDKLIIVVQDAYEELYPKTLSNVWVSLQYHFNEILKVRGSNNFKQPHVGKKGLEDLGQLQNQVQAPLEHVEACLQIVGE